MPTPPFTSFPILTTPLNIFTAVSSGIVPASGGGNVAFLRADGNWAVPPGGGGGGTPGGTSGQIQWNNAGSFGGFTMSGDATLVTSTGVITVANAAITYPKIQKVVANNVLLGNIAGANSTVQELNGTQVTALLNRFTPTLDGLVPFSGGGTTSFLRADGSWVAPPGGGGNPPGGSPNQIQWNSAGAFAGFTMSGDATLVTSTGVITVANSAITYAKMQNSSAASILIGRGAGSGAGALQEITLGPSLSMAGTVLNATGGGTPGGASLTLQYNNAGAFGGMSGTSWDDTNRALTTTGATVTTSHPIWTGTQTWNGSGITFKGFSFNFTDTLSSANSLVENYRVNAIDVWNIRKDGTVTVGIWGGTAVAAAFGGTGQTTYLLGDTLYASAPTTLTKLPGNTTNIRKFLRQLGTGVVSAAPVWDTITVSDVNGAIAAPSPTIVGCYPTWSNAAGQVMDGQGVVNALAYGADPTGGSDSKNQINNALATGRLVYLPSGKYLISGPLIIPQSNNGGIIGDGCFDGAFNCSDWTTGKGTVIIASDLTSHIIDVPNGYTGIRFENFTLCRTSQATSATAVGLRFTGSRIGGNGTGDHQFVRNVIVSNHGIGIVLGYMGGYCYVENVLSQGNKSHGVWIQGQWQLTNVFSADNGGNGFHSAPINSLTNSSGQWSRLSTSGNTGYGWQITAASGQGLEGFRVSDCFFGNDTAGELNIDSYAGNSHKFTNCQFEANSGVTPVILISANNPTIMFDNCYFTGGGAGVTCITSHLTGNRINFTGGGTTASVAKLLFSNCSIQTFSAFGVSNPGDGLLCDGAGAIVQLSNCQVDGWTNGIVMTGTSSQLLISNCSLLSMNSVFPAMGVFGIYTNDGNTHVNKISVTNTSVIGYSVGISANNVNAATALGCNVVAGNTTSLDFAGTTTPFNAGGNY